MSIYIEKLEQIALSNKYTKWYINVCNNANIRSSNRKDAKNLLGYVEGHHILPKCFKLGGEKDKSNLVYLSAREHFIVHWLATKMFKDIFKYKMLYSLKMMGRRTKWCKLSLTSLEFFIIKQTKQPRSKEHSMKIGAKLKGIPRSEETKDKIRNKLKDVKFSDERKEKLKGRVSNNKGKTGYKMTDEQLEKMRGSRPNACHPQRPDRPPRPSGYKRINGKHVYPTDIIGQ